MLQQCTQACRWGFLLVVMVIASYMIFFNEKQVKERFIESSDGQYYETIKTLVQTYLLRQPEQFELERYKRLMKHPKDADPVIEALKKTPEYLELVKASPKSNTMAALTPFLDPGAGNTKIDKIIEDASVKQRTEIYRAIIKAYDSHLERMPTMRELNYYTYRMLTDPKFDQPKLVSVLQSSKEYQILQKNQNNLVQGELSGNITDAQVSMEVRRIYDTVFHDSPDVEMERFLKYKYRSYELNEKRFTEFLLLLKAMDESKVDIRSLADGKVDITVLPIGAHNPTAVTNIVSQEAQAVPKFGVTQEQSRCQVANPIYHQKIFNIINPTEQDLQNLMKEVNADGNIVQQQRATCSTKDYNDPLYESLKEAQKDARKQSCRWDKNGFEKQVESEYNSRNKLAMYQEARNLEELQSNCKRNTYFLNADDDMVLYPNPDQKKNAHPCKTAANNISAANEQPSIMGALLTEVENTRVGSLMPRFIYKETSQ